MKKFIVYCFVFIISISLSIGQSLKNDSLYVKVIKPKGSGDTSIMMNAKKVFFTKDIQVDGTIYGTADTSSVSALADSLKYNNEINVKRFGVVGDSVTDDTQGWKNAVNALKGTGKILLAPDKYRITGTIPIRTGNFTIDGLGTGKMYLDSSAAYPEIFFIGASTLYIDTTKVLTYIPESQKANSALRYIRVADTSNIRADRYLYLRHRENSVDSIYGQITKVKSVSGDTVFCYDDIIIPLDSSYSNAVRVIGSLENLAIRNMSFYGTTRAVSTAGGILSQNTMNCTFENLRFYDMPYFGFWNTLSYNTDINRIYANDSGSDTYSDIYFLLCSNMNFNNLISENSDGYGGSFDLVTTSNINNLIASNDLKRGWMFDASCYNNISNVVSTNSENQGVVFDLGCYKNNLSNVTITGVKSQGALYFATGGVRENHVSNVTITTDTAFGEYGIYFNTGTVGNVVSNASVISKTAKYYDLGSNNILSYGPGNLTIGNKQGNSKSTGTYTFSTTANRTAVYIAGATATDKYSLTNISADGTTLVLLGDCVSYLAKTDSLIVIRNDGSTGTSGLTGTWNREIAP